MVLVIRRTSDVEFSVAMCNTGQGRELHASRVAAPTGQEQVAVSVYLRVVPAKRIIDGTFWYLLLRPLAYPASQHRAEDLYRTIPFLNDQPLTSKEQTLSVPPADWVPSSTSGLFYLYTRPLLIKYSGSRSVWTRTH